MRTRKDIEAEIAEAGVRPHLKAELLLDIRDLLKKK